MDSKQIDVMVADASHEVYVDKILDTIREAAKVRGTGIDPDICKKEPLPPECHREHLHPYLPASILQIPADWTFPI